MVTFTAGVVLNGCGQWIARREGDLRDSARAMAKARARSFFFFFLESVGGGCTADAACLRFLPPLAAGGMTEAPFAPASILLMKIQIGKPEVPRRSIA